MNMYIAFLRAINVGGRVVKMELLRKLFADMGYSNVRTYIQSGNVVFECGESDTQTIEQTIEKALIEQLGYEVPSFVYTPAQLQQIVDSCPFRSVPEKMALHVSLLSGCPSVDDIDSLLQFQTEHEQYEVVGKVVYIMVLQGKYGETKFSNTFLEKKLKVKATTRNWATINKMAQVV